MPNKPLPDTLTVPEDISTELKSAFSTRKNILAKATLDDREGHTIQFLDIKDDSGWPPAQLYCVNPSTQTMACEN